MLRVYEKTGRRCANNPPPAPQVQAAMRSARYLNFRADPIPALAVSLTKGDTQ